MPSIRQHLTAAIIGTSVTLGSSAFADDDVLSNEQGEASQSIQESTLEQQIFDALYYTLGYHLDGAELRSDATNVDVTFCREYVDNDFKEGLVACLQEITEIAEKLGERAENTLDRGNYFGVIDNEDEDITLVRRNITNSCFAYDELLDDLRNPGTDKDATLEDLHFKLSNCFDFSLLVLRKSEKSSLEEKSERFSRLANTLSDPNYSAPDRTEIWLDEYPFDATIEDYIQRPRWFIDPPAIFGWQVPSPIATLNSELPSCDAYEQNPDDANIGLQCLIEIAPVAKNYGTFARDRLEYDYIGQEDETPAAEWQAMEQSYARLKGHCYSPAELVDGLGNLDPSFIDTQALSNALAHDISACFNEANAITEARRSQRLSEIASEYDEIAEALAFESFDLFELD